MNKKHWNTAILNGSIPVGEIERMIDHSYGLAVKGLKKVEREALELSYGKDVILSRLNSHQRQTLTMKERQQTRHKYEPDQ